MNATLDSEGTGCPVLYLGKCEVLPLLPVLRRPDHDRGAPVVNSI